MWMDGCPGVGVSARGPTRACVLAYLTTVPDAPRRPPQFTSRIWTDVWCSKFGVVLTGISLLNSSGTAYGPDRVSIFCTLFHLSLGSMSAPTCSSILLYEPGQLEFLKTTFLNNNHLHSS